MGIYGTPEQKQRHLPAIAAGREKWAIGFTEPGGGTDVLGALRTTAIRADGGWVVNGQKTWSSMAHVADYILLLVRTTKDVEKQYQGVSLFILPTASEGVTIREIPKLGMRALGSCDVFLDDVFVADENLLGEPDQAWKMLLPTLNNERIMLRRSASASWTACWRTRCGTRRSARRSGVRSASSRRCSTTSPTSRCGGSRPT